MEFRRVLFRSQHFLSLEENPQFHFEVGKHQLQAFSWYLEGWCSVEDMKCKRGSTVTKPHMKACAIFYIFPVLINLQHSPHRTGKGLDSL